MRIDGAHRPHRRRPAAGRAGRAPPPPRRAVPHRHPRPLVGRRPHRGRQVGARDLRPRSRRPWCGCSAIPTTCPHGNPIPGSDYAAPDRASPSTSSAWAPAFTVRRIPEELEFAPGLLEFLEESPLVPGRHGHGHRRLTRRHHHRRDRGPPRRHRRVRQHPHPRHRRLIPAGTGASPTTTSAAEHDDPGREQHRSSARSRAQAVGQRPAATPGRAGSGSPRSRRSARCACSTSTSSHPHSTSPSATSPATPRRPPAPGLGSWPADERQDGRDLPDRTTRWRAPGTGTTTTT